MQMQRKQAVAIAVVCSLLSINATCNRSSPDVIVNNVAGYGARVSQILSDSQDLVKAGSPSVIPEAAAAKVQAALIDAASVGLKLTDALAVYDALAPANVEARSAAVLNINKLIDELRKYTRVVLVFVGNNAVGAQLLTLYDNLEAVFSEIQAGIDRWQLQQVEAN